MAIVINGNGTISGLSVGGLPDGSVDQDTLAAGVGGKILQIVSSGNYTTNDSTSSGGGNVADMGLTAAITPTTNTSKIIAFMNLMVFHSASSINALARIKRTGPSTVYSGFVQDFYHPSGGGVVGNINVIFRDSPASTSQCTYTAQLGYYGGAGGNTVQLNKDYNGNVNGQSHILLMEIA